MNRTTALIALTIAGAGLLAACGGDDASSTPTAAPAAPTPAVASVPPAPTTTVPTPGSTVAVKSAETGLGPILVGVDGRTLYGFTNDTPIQSNCEGTCAEAWPPVVVSRQLDGCPGCRQRDLQHDHPLRRHAATRRRQVPPVRLLGRYRSR